MSLPYQVASTYRRSAPLLLRNSAALRPPIATCSQILDARGIASSSRSSAQVQDGAAPKQQETAKHSPEAAESTKLGKRARKAIRARQRKEEERAAREEKAKARTAEREKQQAKSLSRAADISSSSEPKQAILKVRHVLPTAADTSPSKRTAQIDEAQEWRRQARSGDGSNPTQGWSGNLFRSHISALLRGFGTLPNTPPVQEAAQPPLDANPEPEETPASLATGRGAESTSETSQSKPPAMSKSERMESQARVIFRAIRDARERGIVDEDESFFYPYPEGVPPKDQNGKDAVWLNLGSDPEAWGREIPPVNDRWLEVLSLGLTKEIHPSSDVKRPRSEGEDTMALSALATQSELAFEDLVEDYDLENHERLEQLGDSIVNMSSRLLAYQTFPDVNEGSLTRLSNYPTQNNFLALLFQECGLATRRDELQKELRKAREAELAGDDRHAAQSRNDTAVNRVAKALEGEEESDKRVLPSVIKRDADMFEAYTAAVFLSHGNDFNVVHAWLSGLFRPFQDQAYRFMVQRSEALARWQATRAAASPTGATASPTSTSSALSFLGLGSPPPSPTNLSADGLGIKAATVDPSSASLSALFPDFLRAEKSTSPIPTYVLQGGNEAFITDEFLTVAARARRQREERMREELRRQDQEELMNMGWFRKGFMNLSQGFRQFVMGKDLVREEEMRMRERLHQQRGLKERDRERLRARERNLVGVSIKSTGSKARTKLTRIPDEGPSTKD